MWTGLLTLLHSERPKLYTVLAFLSAIVNGYKCFLALENKSTDINEKSEENMKNQINQS